MKFDFFAPSKILFGCGRIAEAADIARTFGDRVLLVAGNQAATATRIAERLVAEGQQVEIFHVACEPSVDLVEAGVNLVKQCGAKSILAVGGGSAIDAAKAIAGLATNPGELMDYLEVVGRGKTINAPPLPVIAVPTTAGTGSEVTRNAVISVPEEKVKVSLRSPLLVPKVAIVDPELTVSMPTYVTANTGMDALSQVIEPFVSMKANPIVDAFCLQGMARAGKSLVAAFTDGENLQAREDMCVVSLMGGLALANGGLGAVHGFAAPLGGMFQAAHGALCARLLGPVVRMNARALSQRAPLHPALERYAEAAKMITGKNLRVEEFADWLDDLCQRLNIQHLADLGVEATMVAEIIERASAASSMQANPIRLTPDELSEILYAAI